MAENPSGNESASGISPSGDGDFSQTSDTATDTPSTESTESLTAMVESAMDRAEKSHQENNQTTDEIRGKRQIEDSSSTSEQAATSDSTPSDKEDIQGSGVNGGTSGQGDKPTGDSTPEQSLTPPDNWPEDRRKEFSTLPDTGKSLLMSIYRDMEKGLKQSFEKLANDRKAIEANYGLDETQLKDLVSRYQTYQTDPVATISQLAEEAGIEVFFNQQTDEIPEFDNQADLVRWLQEQSRKEARQAAATEAKTLKDQRHQQEVKQRMEKEFAEAYKAHHDLPDHKEAVIKYISGFNLPVEMAYRLATYEGLVSLAQNGNSLKAELDKAKGELEKLQKLATMPPGRGDGRSRKQQTNGVDMFETAYNAAEKVISSQ